MAALTGWGIQRACLSSYRGFFQDNYKKFRTHSGTRSSSNEFPSVYPPPKKYRLVRCAGFYCVEVRLLICSRRLLDDDSTAPAYAKQAGFPSGLAPRSLTLAWVRGCGMVAWQHPGPSPQPGHPSGAALPAWHSPVPAARRNLTRKQTWEKSASGFQACPGSIDFGSESVVPGRRRGRQGSPADAAARASNQAC